MGKCKDCRFMAAPRRQNDWATCHGVEFDWEQHRPNPKRLAIVVDGSGYSAALLVQPDFGCEHWESKNDADK